LTATAEYHLRHIVLMVTLYTQYESSHIRDRRRTRLVSTAPRVLTHNTCIYIYIYTRIHKHTRIQNIHIYRLTGCARVCVYKKSEKKIALRINITKNRVGPQNVTRLQAPLLLYTYTVAAVSYVYVSKTSVVLINFGF